MWYKFAKQQLLETGGLNYNNIPVTSNEEFFQTILPYIKDEKFKTNGLNFLQQYPHLSNNYKKHIDSTPLDIVVENLENNFHSLNRPTCPLELLTDKELFNIFHKMYPEVTSAIFLQKLQEFKSSIEYQNLLQSCADVQVVVNTLAFKLNLKNRNFTTNINFENLDAMLDEKLSLSYILSRQDIYLSDIINYALSSEQRREKIDQDVKNAFLGITKDQSYDAKSKYRFSKKHNYSNEPYLLANLVSLELLSHETAEIVFSRYSEICATLMPPAGASMLTKAILTSFKYGSEKYKSSFSTLINQASLSQSCNELWSKPWLYDSNECNNMINYDNFNNKSTIRDFSAALGALSNPNVPHHTCMEVMNNLDNIDMNSTKKRILVQILSRPVYSTQDAALQNHAFNALLNAHGLNLTEQELNNQIDINNVDEVQNMAQKIYGLGLNLELLRMDSIKNLQNVITSGLMKSVSTFDNKHTKGVKPWKNTGIFSCYFTGKLESAMDYTGRESGGYAVSNWILQLNEIAEIPVILGIKSIHQLEQEGGIFSEELETHSMRTQNPPSTLREALMRVFSLYKYKEVLTNTPVIDRRRMTSYRVLNEVNKYALPRHIHAAAWYSGVGVST